MGLDKDSLIRQQRK